MNYKDFLDHVLGVYYFTKKNNPKMALNPYWVIEIIQGGYGAGDVRDILNYLGAEGYLKYSNQSSGIISQITPKGQMYFESLNSSKSKGIENFLKERKIMPIIENFKNITEGETFNKEKTLDLIKKIKSELEKLNNIDHDLMADIEIIKLEYSKRNPDKEALRIKVESILDENILYDKISDLKYKLNV